MNREDIIDDIICRGWTLQIIHRPKEMRIIITNTNNYPLGIGSTTQSFDDMFILEDLYRQAIRTDEYLNQLVVWCDGLEQQELF